MLATVACCIVAPRVTYLNRVVNDPVAAFDGLGDGAERPGPTAKCVRVESLFDLRNELACCPRSVGSGGIKDAQDLSKDSLCLCRLDYSVPPEPIHFGLVVVPGRYDVLWTEADRRVHPIPHLSPGDELFVWRHELSIAASRVRGVWIRSSCPGCSTSLPV